MHACWLERFWLKVLCFSGQSMELKFMESRTIFFQVFSNNMSIALLHVKDCDFKLLTKHHHLVQHSQLCSYQCQCSIAPNLLGQNHNNTLALCTNWLQIKLLGHSHKGQNVSIQIVSVQKMLNTWTNQSRIQFSKTKWEYEISHFVIILVKHSIPSYDNCLSEILNLPNCANSLELYILKTPSPSYETQQDPTK